MARPWRIEFEGALYHLLARGNERRDIVSDDLDRRRLLETLGEAAERFAVEILAYVIMPNHYHLLVRTRQANLSRAMHWLGTTYTQRYNRRHSRSGHLFQGRFKSLLVENDDYLLRLSFYIHRNPLRAGLVSRLADYPWSSYRAYAYGRGAPAWLETGLILARFSGVDPHRSYREMARVYAKEEVRLWEDVRHGMALGTREFVERLRSAHLSGGIEPEKPQQRAVAGSLGVEAYVGRARAFFGWDEGGLKRGRRLRGRAKEERDLVVYWLWNTGWFKNEEIGVPLGLGGSAVSHAVRSMRRRIGSETHLQQKLEALNSQFTI